MAPSSAVVALRRVGARGPDIELDRLPGTFTIGSGRRANVAIDLPGLADVHSLVERRTDELHVYDLAPHGRAIESERTPRHCVRAGMVFRVGRVAFLALDAALRELRPMLAWCLGLDAHLAIDNALVMAADDGPLLLTGPRGCDQLALARAIHAASPRRHRPFAAARGDRGGEVLSSMRRARRGSVFVEAGSDLPATVVRALLDGAGTRPIIASWGDRALDRMLGVLVRGRAIVIPPLRERPAEIPRLIDAALAELGGRRRIGSLGHAAIRRLGAYGWPGNLHELRAAARHLAALLESGGVAAAGPRAPAALRSILGASTRRA